jgi:DNA polymerase V
MYLIRKIKQGETRLPLYSGVIACGLFGVAEDFVEDTLSIDEMFSKNKQSTFYVRSGGDSMSPEIKAQDILVVDKSISPKVNSIVAFFLNGNPICKLYVKEHNQLILRSFNKNYKDIVISESDQLHIFGTVIGIARTFL